MARAIVQASNVSKQFRLGETHDSLRDLIAAGLGRLLRRGSGKTGARTFWALRDVSFTVGQGEAVGIIGPNGAGKSTILRLLAGILRPDAGTVAVDGRLSALIEVGAGFHGDLTGRENVFLSGAILGMTRSEIRRKLDAIVSFAGIERFLDMPVKRYSSGMYARLGFSIAAHVDPDVLLVDEVLSVGDALFRVRCLERMRELVRSGSTLVFVTHQLDQMQSICGRAIVVECGRAVYTGTARDAVGHYLKAMSRTHAHRAGDMVTEQGCRDGAIDVTGLRFLNKDGEEVLWTRSNEALCAELRFRIRRPIPRLILELSMGASFNEGLFSVNSGRDGLTYPGTVGEHTVSLSVPRLPLGGGQYFWNVRMWDAERGVVEVDTPFRYPLAVDDGGCNTGPVCLEHEWSFARLSTVDASDEKRAASRDTEAGAELEPLVACGEDVEDLPVR